MAHDLQNRDVFGYYVDKGWMCAGFLCSAGKLIERNVNLFHTTMMRTKTFDLHRSVLQGPATFDSLRGLDTAGY